MKKLQKKDSKKQYQNVKGITLVALVITIVVLLILAGVTITTLFGESGIITKAQKAKGETENGVTDELEGLSNLEDQISGKWRDNGNGTLKNGSTIVSIGDYVNYNEGSFTYTPDITKGVGTNRTSGGGKVPVILGTTQLTTENLTWRVLGINENGQLELVSSNQTSQDLYLANDTGWINVESNLDTFCDELYGKGENAEKARSLDLNDIDKLTKYDKTKYSGYGEIWQYRFPDGGTHLQYRRKAKEENASWSNWENIVTDVEEFQNFRMPGNNAVIDSESPGEGKELVNTIYSYNIAENITVEDGYTTELVTTIYDMITIGKKRIFLACI